MYERIEQAEKHGKDALHAAKELRRLDLEAHVKLELAFVKVRRAQLERLRVVSEEQQISFQKDAAVAVRKVEWALERLQIADEEQYQANRDHARWWIERISGH